MLYFCIYYWSPARAEKNGGFSDKHHLSADNWDKVQAAAGKQSADWKTTGVNLWLTEKIGVG